jgi:hypothetical protein
VALFDAGVVKVSLRRAILLATVRIDAGLDGSPKHTQSGRLGADWELTLGSTPLITFRDTNLHFDESGKTSFDLNPEKVQLNGVLKMVSDALASVGSSGSGFSLKLLEENGFPVGIEAALELALPDIASGPCSLSHLRFGASLLLTARPEFGLGLRVHLAEKSAPFTLIVFILGGGGWLDARAFYYPLSGRVTTSVSLGINAAAMLAVAFGPVKGSVAAYFFLEAELLTDSKGQGNSLHIHVGLMLRGEVDVAGLISVTITLVLELEYRSENKKLVGHGTLSIKVKICWLLTISVSVSVNMEFASLGGGGGGQTSSNRLLGPDALASAADLILPPSGFGSGDKLATIAMKVDEYLSTLA